jgi:hypothetical protein
MSDATRASWSSCQTYDETKEASTQSLYRLGADCPRVLSDALRQLAKLAGAELIRALARHTGGRGDLTSERILPE